MPDLRARLTALVTDHTERRLGGYLKVCTSCGYIDGEHSSVCIIGELAALLRETPEPAGADEKQRYALRQCYVLALREARREQHQNPNQSSRWNHIIRFCRDADLNGTITASSVLRDTPAVRRCPTCDSPSPELHPSVQWEGEVQPCRDEWHISAPNASRG